MGKKKKNKKEKITIDKDFYDIILKTNANLKLANVELGKENSKLKKDPKPAKTADIVKPIAPFSAQPLKKMFIELSFRVADPSEMPTDGMKQLLADVGELMKKHKVIKLNAIAFHKWLP